VGLLAYCSLPPSAGPLLEQLGFALVRQIRAVGAPITLDLLDHASAIPDSVEFLACSAPMRGAVYSFCHKVPFGVVVSIHPTSEVPILLVPNRIQGAKCRFGLSGTEFKERNADSRFREPFSNYPWRNSLHCVDVRHFISRFGTS
jgi:hypothetical protein